jgi:acyl-CoA dehydrogenase
LDFSFNDEQKMMIDTIRRFIAEELHPLEDELENQGFLPKEKSLAIFEKSRALGLYALNIPEQLGGGGLSALDRIMCEEQFGHTSDYLIRRAFGNVYEPLLECKGAQIGRWLEPTVRRARTCSIAITETGAGSDAAGIKTSAKKTDGRLGAQRQQAFHQRRRVERLLSWSPPRPGTRKSACSWSTRDLPGFTLGKDQKMMGSARHTAPGNVF